MRPIGAWPHRVPLGPRNGPQTRSISSNYRLDLSPVTESNRRPSPYHWVPINPLTRHFSERPAQTLYFNSVGISSGRLAKDATSQIPPNPARRKSHAHHPSHALRPG